MIRLIHRHSRRSCVVGLAMLVAMTPHADAQNSAAVTKLVQVRIVVVQGGSRTTIPGVLYKYSNLTINRLRIAQVTESGDLPVPIDCNLADTFLAEPVSPIYKGNRTPKPCGRELEFSYGVVTFADSSGRAEVAENFAQSGKWGEAAGAYSNINAAILLRATKMQGEEKEGEIVRARAAGEAAIVTTAVTLGDRNLDKYVVRDPAQDNALVFSPVGIRKLRELQRNSNLPETGKLDFLTQRRLSTLSHKPDPAAGKIWETVK